MSVLGRRSAILHDNRGTSKRCALCQLLATIFLDFMDFHETIISRKKERVGISPLFPGWNFCAVDSCRFLGSLFLAWNLCCAQFNAYSFDASLVLNGVFKDFNFPTKILNFYGPY